MNYLMEIRDNLKQHQVVQLLACHLTIHIWLAILHTTRAAVWQSHADAVEDVRQLLLPVTVLAPHIL